MSIVSDWFQNEKSTRMFQAIFSFAFGMVLAHWGSGLFFLVLFIIFYEIAYYVFSHGKLPYWDPFTRVAVINSSLLGWIVGRTLLDDTVLQEGVPGMG